MSTETSNMPDDNFQQAMLDTWFAKHMHKLLPHIFEVASNEDQEEAKVN